ncbi:MAG: bifunctional diaminohydroxyphosphoribosylaminopyrimidine deaminase/5-amino-6-(5-phosphoribosylamino)uracil reductase RibD [Rhodocyclaceae bacterium]|nr:bifunctional diaminohydroxyphosphoribosylaminopyrimidine deaminase/5-amino-6-(5-phosphoribosylamino)uracil reductase RibD [Rhodocyclaceae bacterium]
MSEALRLAERGLLSTSPNPRVGCVIVRDHELVGRGWHERAGEAHAEVHALQGAGRLAEGATAYVSLEPCAHHGRTPPCTDALIAAGVRRVVAAMQDPNPAVSGRGLARLSEAGIDTACGLLESQAEALNCGFVSRMRRGRPWLRVKLATSLDGRTALANGQSQWITGTEARADGHRWRARSCAVLTGVGTVLADDPQLTVRAVRTYRQPIRVVVDSQLRTPPAARVLEAGRTLVYCAEGTPERIAALQARGAEVICLPDESGRRVDLWSMLRSLADLGINEVLSEAGATLNGALVAAGCVDELVVYQAPMLLGHLARAGLELPAFANLQEAGRWQLTDVRQIGSDLRVILAAMPD